MAIVQTRKTHRYGGKLRQSGDRYEAAPQDLRVIQALGWARVVTDEPTESKAEVVSIATRGKAKPAAKAAAYKTKPMVARAPEAPTPAAAAPKFDEPEAPAPMAAPLEQPAHGYERRDMTAGTDGQGGE